MFLRFSLIITLVAGLAALYFSHVQVQEKITTITTERNDFQKQAEDQSAAASKARTAEKKAKDDLDRTTKELTAKTETLDATAAKLAEQQKRADKLFEDFTNTTRDRNEAQQELARFKATGRTPEQILMQRDELLKVIAERDAFVGENKILLRNIGQIKYELSRFIDLEKVAVPLPAGLKGKIVAVDPKWDFVVLDIGGNQGAAENGEMLVNRDGKFVAKVRITKVEPNRSIANILPDWKQVEVIEGDQVLY